jgi:putative photosynthetic complex assembly protein
MRGTVYQPKPFRSFPRAPLWGALALIIVAIGLAAVGRITGSTSIPTNGVPVATRELRFLDRPDHGVDVMDATTGNRVETVTGQAGFIRAALRTLASARKRAGEDAGPPFRLTAWQDGRLTLDDPTNGRHVELEAFGPDNEAVFAAMLQKPETKPETKPESGK